MSICRKSGVGLICLSNFKLNHSKTCQLFSNPLVRWMPTQLAQLFPETKKTSETEPLSRPKSIIWRERPSRRPLAAHYCLQNPQSHICGLLQNLAEQFQLLTAIAQTGSHNELCGGLSCDWEGWGRWYKGGSWTPSLEQVHRGVRVKTTMHTNDPLVQSANYWKIYKFKTEKSSNLYTAYGCLVWLDSLVPQPTCSWKWHPDTCQLGNPTMVRL